MPGPPGALGAALGDQAFAICGVFTASMASFELGEHGQLVDRDGEKGHGEAAESHTLEGRGALPEVVGLAVEPDAVGDDARARDGPADVDERGVGGAGEERFAKGRVGGADSSEERRERDSAERVGVSRGEGFRGENLGDRDGSAFRHERGELTRERRCQDRWCESMSSAHRRQEVEGRLTDGGTGKKRRDHEHLHDPSWCAAEDPM